MIRYKRYYKVPLSLSYTGTYFAKQASYSDGYSNAFGTQGKSGFGFSFGTPNPPGIVVLKRPSNPTTAGLNFGSINANIYPTTGFNFGSTNTAPALVAMFGKSVYAKPAVNIGSSSNNPFTFGQPASNSSTQQQNVFTFGPPTAGFGVAQQQNTGFGSNVQQQSTGFGSNVQQSGGFGTNINKTTGFGSNVQQSGRSQNPGFGTITYGTTFGNTSGPCDSTAGNDGNVPDITAEIGKVLRTGYKYMFVARVLVGRYCHGQSGMRKPPKDENDPKKRPFNSCVNNVQHPSIFVIFDSAQAYPEYLVEYK